MQCTVTEIDTKLCSVREDWVWIQENLALKNSVLNANKILRLKTSITLFLNVNKGLVESEIYSNGESLFDSIKF